MAYSNRPYDAGLGRVARSDVGGLGEQLQSHVWNWHRPDSPEIDLLPKSPMRCLCFNPQAYGVVVGGTAAGTVSTFAHTTATRSQRVDRVP